MPKEFRSFDFDRRDRRITNHSNRISFHSQSTAILRHVARKADLVRCDTLEELAVIEMLEQEAIDFRKRLTDVCHSESFEKFRSIYLDNQESKLAAWSNQLGMRLI